MLESKEEILASGLALGKIKVLLEVVAGLKPKEIEEAIEEAGIKSKRSNGFASDYYDYLKEEERTEEEALSFILGTEGNEVTSKNVKNHESHYLNIFELVKDVRDSLESNS